MKPLSTVGGSKVPRECYTSLPFVCSLYDHFLSQSDPRGKIELPFTKTHVQFCVPLCTKVCTKIQYVRQFWYTSKRRSGCTIFTGTYRISYQEFMFFSVHEMICTNKNGTLNCTRSFWSFGDQALNLVRRIVREQIVWYIETYVLFFSCTHLVLY